MSFSGFGAARSPHLAKPSCAGRARGGDGTSEDSALANCSYLCAEDPADRASLGLAARLPLASRPRVPPPLT